jgi:hypothetical protein
VFVRKGPVVCHNLRIHLNYVVIAGGLHASIICYIVQLHQHVVKVVIDACVDRLAESHAWVQTKPIIYIYIICGLSLSSYLARAQLIHY